MCRGFDTFFGYYQACEADYWYHAAPGNPAPNCSVTGKGIGNNPTDLSNSTGPRVSPAAGALNGTYNTRLLADEAARLVRAHDRAVPFYMYLAFMAVHDGCAEPKDSPFFSLGKQAPVATVARYGTTVLDTYKVAGAMYTEMDAGIATVVGALKENQMWANTAFIFVSDNGGPLDHCTNEPLRGGKHTFFEVILCSSLAQAKTGIDVKLLPSRTHTRTGRGARHGLRLRPAPARAAAGDTLGRDGGVRGLVQNHHGGDRGGHRAGQDRLPAARRA